MTRLNDPRTIPDGSQYLTAGFETILQSLQAMRDSPYGRTAGRRASGHALAAGPCRVTGRGVAGERFLLFPSRPRAYLPTLRLLFRGRMLRDR